MSAYSRNTLATKFNDIYQVLNDSKKDLFAKLCDKLLGYNFVYGQLSEDKNDYYSILEMRDVIEAYFAMIEFQLVHDDMRKIFYLESSSDRNRVRLKKMEIKKLQESYPELKFYHFGDIDAGGIYILRHLISKTGIECNLRLSHRY